MDKAPTFSSLWLTTNLSMVPENEEGSEYGNDSENSETY
jgi:hypothetical protein